jgi:protein-L-isoaspartate(D-aspartate) O-methyltransferase
MVGRVTDERLHQYATNVTAGVRNPAIPAAFAHVPRALFVSLVVDRDGRPIAATPDVVYSDEALVTRVHDGWPTSSSSQPSLMARMLDVLDLAPGLRVLEIGTGTGYNAAVIATITGAPVVTVDIQPDVVEQARTALKSAGAATVEVVLGDGFLGVPAHGPYDRIIATVGVGGVPQHWIDQLAPGGLVIAPTEHGGIQPCVLSSHDRGHLTGRGAAASGFMVAAGPLYRAERTPRSLKPGGNDADNLPEIPVPPVPDRRYYDLWFALAAYDHRITRCRIPGYDDDGVQCVLIDPNDGAVLVQRDALRPIEAAPSLVEHARALVSRWHSVGQPPVTAWRCGFRCDDGLWTPVNWNLTR